jgi:hypothetical protein
MLGFVPIGPTGDLTTKLDSTTQWTEHHTIVKTRLNHTAPRNEFGMEIQPPKGQTRMPSTIAIALAVKFSHESKPFAIDFTFSTSGCSVP